MYRIKSKITNKIVHQYPDMDIRVLAELCNLFGQDYPKYLASLDTEWFNPDRRKFDILTTPNKNYLTVNNNFVIESKIRTIDKERIIKFLNNVITQKGSDNREMFSTMLKSVVMIADHLNMLKIIREYDEFKNFDGLNVNDFMEEHTEFSTTIAKIKKGWTTEYQFNKDMLSDMEKPVAIEINVGDKTNPKVAIMTFYPKVLKTEEEYIEEGTFMHHCVASYADKDKSVIISMRTEDSKDRITCEFDGQSGACLQARHFCNAPIPADFDLALDTVKEKTKYYSRRGMLHHTHKKRVPLVINNIEVKPTIVEPRLNEGLFIF
jgi:hypothetical protein